MRARILSFLSLCVALLSTASLGALADQRYSVSGSDRYTMGSAANSDTLSLTGDETLTIRKRGSRTEFTAQLSGTQSDGSETLPLRGSFTQVLTSSGDLRDEANADPQFATILNQPFDIEIDGQTLNDLLHSRARLMLNMPAPLTGGTLRGYLQRGAIARVGSVRALQVRFDATGPAHGRVAGDGAPTIGGTVQMHGTAYYALRGVPLLLGLDETFTMTAALHDEGRTVPVVVVHRRRFRAISTDVPFSVGASPFD